MLRASHKIGIDANRPLIVEGPQKGTPAPTVADPAIIAETGAGWVRLNFVLGPWSSPTDKTPFQGRTWEETYRSILVGFRQKGLSIYGLIGHEAVKEDPANIFRAPPEEVSANTLQKAQDWIGRYVADFLAIVRMFHKHVKIFESFNEPDDWRGLDRNWVHPAWFATMLHEIHTAVKRDPEIKHVKLISGPLQGLEINHNAAAPYLAATYAEGVRRFGWGLGVPFPFDGVGYHLYIHEGRNDDWADQEQKVRRTYRCYVDAMRDVIRQAEGRDKPLYVSEFGWFSNRGLESFQADNLQLGLSLMAADPAVDLAIWFCMQDFGEDEHNKYYGLYRQGPLTPENRKPAYHVYKTFVQTPIPTAPSLFDNQTMINALYAAANELGMEGWKLVEKAGLEHLIFARKDPYTGPPVEELFLLTEEERAALKRALTDLVPALQRKPGITTGHLNLRSGPGTQHDVITVLPANTEVDVLAQEGDWLRVSALGQVGYVHRAFVALEEERVRLGFLRTWEELKDVPLPPPKEEMIAPQPEMDFLPRVLAETWNRCGGLLAVVANELKLDPAFAVAVFVAEAPRGKGFADDGRMIIRFENHVFYDRWGSRYPDVYAQHFRFDPKQRWKGHLWRRAPDAPWRDVHPEQSQEWEAFEFARTLDDTAAKLSISMGAPQIMGFNYTSIGYESVDEMFAAFSADERAQILGFFDYVKGPEATSPRLRALQKRDFVAFAEQYNGTGLVEIYSTRIRNYYETFQKLRAGEPVSHALAWMEEPVEEGSRDLAALPGPEEELEPEELGLFDEWREDLRAHLARSEEMFHRIVASSLSPYQSALWLPPILLGVSIAAFLVAVTLAAWLRTATLPLLFAALSVAAFLIAAWIRPTRRLDEELAFLTWLRVVSSTYRARLMHLWDLETAPEELARAHQEATDEIQRILDRRAGIEKR